MKATFIHCPKCNKVVQGECKCDAPDAPDATVADDAKAPAKKKK